MWVPFYVAKLINLKQWSLLMAIFRQHDFMHGFDDNMVHFPLSELTRKHNSNQRSLIRMVTNFAAEVTVNSSRHEWICAAGLRGLVYEIGASSHLYYRLGLSTKAMSAQTLPLSRSLCLQLLKCCVKSTEWIVLLKQLVLILSVTKQVMRILHLWRTSLSNFRISCVNMVGGCRFTLTRSCGSSAKPPKLDFCAKFEMFLAIFDMLMCICRLLKRFLKFTSFSVC